MESTVLSVSEEAARTLRELTSGGQPVIVTDLESDAVAVILDLDSYQEACELGPAIEALLLVDAASFQVGVILDAASYQQAEAIALAV